MYARRAQVLRRHLRVRLEHERRQRQHEQHRLSVQQLANRLTR